MKKKPRSRARHAESPDFVNLSPGNGARGWEDEDSLHLTVVATENASAMETSPVPLLLAVYGSARVAEPLHLKNEMADDAGAGPEERFDASRHWAGTRWQRIIAMQRFLVDYTNGKENPQLCVKLADGSERTFDEPTEEFLRLLGTQLFEMLFTGEVKRLYDAARFSHKRRRLNIVFTSMIPWIADFPWELAFDPGCESFLATSDVRFVRNVLTPVPADGIEQRPKLRILVASAQPSGSVPLSVEQETQRIKICFNPLTVPCLADVEVMARATPEALHECLRSQPEGLEFDVVHFIGHGVWDHATGVGYVLFEDENGCERKVSAGQLLPILRARGVRVVFLNACETGRGSSGYNQGVAMVLAREGVPAVVANQYSVVDNSASLFALHFYGCLAAGLGIADAMREARIAVRYSQSEPMDWGVPVLFARNPRATLCTPRAPEREPKSPSVSVGRAKPRRIKHPLRVAVWSLSYALTFSEKLDSILARMNDAQSEFGFLLKERPIPPWMWKVENRSGYLNVERIEGRLDTVREGFDVDYLFCVTDLPMRDSKTANLYLWSGEGGDSGARVFVMSTWGLSPPLEGSRFQAGFANCVAISLLEEVSSVSPRKSERKFTVGYYNAERDVAHIAGKLKINPDLRKRIKRKGKITDDQMAAIETLLEMFHNNTP